MTTKAELETKIEELRTQIDALPDDEQPWEPPGGQWSVCNDGKVLVDAPSLPRWAEFGCECQTKDEAIALRDRMYARNRIDAWIRKNGGEGKWAVRSNADGSKAHASLATQEVAFGELTTDEQSARRCADLINRGLLNLAWPRED